MLSSLSFKGSPVCHAVESQLTSKLRSATASAVAMAAAGAPCECAAPPLEANGALTSTLSCSPPKTYTRTSNLTRRLTVPTTALACAAKTRRKSKSRGGGGGGDDEVPEGGDDEPPFGGSGGGDDDDGSDWWRDDWGEGDSGPQRPGAFQDLALLWGLFCALCLVQSVQYLVRRGAPPRPSGVLAVLSLAQLRRPPVMQQAAAVVAGGAQ